MCSVIGPSHSTLSRQNRLQAAVSRFPIPLTALPGDLSQRGYSQAEAEGLLRRAVQLAQEARDGFWSKYQETSLGKEPGALFSVVEKSRRWKEERVASSRLCFSPLPN